MTAPMTSRERMLVAIHHEKPDRIPVSPWGLGWIGPDSALAAELIARTDPWLEIGLGCRPVGGATYPVEEERQGGDCLGGCFIRVHESSTPNQKGRSSSPKTSAISAGSAQLPGAVGSLGSRTTTSGCANNARRESAIR